MLELCLGLGVGRIPDRRIVMQCVLRHDIFPVITVVKWRERAVAVSKRTSERAHEKIRFHVQTRFPRWTRPFRDGAGRSVGRLVDGR